MNIYTSGVIGSDEHIYFIPDTTPGWKAGGINERLDFLVNTLEDFNCTDIKLVGFSEGAATVGAFLDKLANNSKFLKDSPIRDELQMAVLMEAPTAPFAAGIMNGYTDNTLKNLPERLLLKAGIKIQLGYIFNSASVVGSIVPKGWGGKTYSYTSYHPNALINPILPYGIEQFYSQNHSDILHNKYTVDVIVDMGRSINK
jgi:hypothetical protein